VPPLSAIIYSPEEGLVDELSPILWIGSAVCY